MKQSKKVIAVLLAVVLAFAVLPNTGVSAADGHVPHVILEADFLDKALFRGASYTVDVYLQDLTSYAVALPFLFNTKLIELTKIGYPDAPTDYESVAQGSGFLGEALKFDACNAKTRDLAAINEAGKFLLSLRPTSTASPKLIVSGIVRYFTIEFKVKEDAVIDSEGGWMFKEFNKEGGIETDPHFGKNGVFGSIKDDFGAYYLTEDTTADYGDPSLHDAAYNPLRYVMMTTVQDGMIADAPAPDTTEPDIPLVPAGSGSSEITLEDTTLKIVSVKPNLPTDPSGNYVTTLGEYKSIDITAEFGEQSAQAIVAAGVKWTVYKGSDTTDLSVTLLGNPGDKLDPRFTPTEPGVYTIRVTSNVSDALYDEIVIVVKQSVAIQGRALLTGKHRANITTPAGDPSDGYDYTARKPFMDMGIKVQLFEVDPMSGSIVRTIGNPVYTEEKDMSDVVTNGAASDVYNYTLYVPSEVAIDFATTGKYLLRFTRIGNTTADGAPITNAREESYLCAELLIDGSAAGIGDTTTGISIKEPTYLYAGAFYVPSEAKESIGINDLEAIKAQVGNPKNDVVWNINEYLGVDAADYATVLRFMNKAKNSAGTANIAAGDWE